MTGSLLKRRRYDASNCSYSKLAFLAADPSMPRLQLRPRKAPVQSRSQATVQAILEAAARVLSRQSLPGFNTNRVAEVAGVSIGTLYQYFPNKEALIGALIERGQAALADAVQQAVDDSAGKSLRASIAALVRVAIEHQFGQPLLAAALDHEERRLPLQRVLRESEQRIAGSLTALLSRHARKLRVAPDATAAGDCLTIAKAMVDAAGLSSAKPAANLQQRVERALLGYLLC
jgi:AcrR family transcriptional regulator